MTTYRNLAAGATLCVAFLAAGCTPEPSAEGRSLTVWLEELNSSSPSMRAHAAGVIQFLGPRAKVAIPRLAELLNDSEPLVRHAAAQALGKFGTAARSAGPALYEAAKKDDFPPARLAEEEALRVVDPELYVKLKPPREPD